VSSASPVLFSVANIEFGNPRTTVFGLIIPNPDVFRKCGELPFQLSISYQVPKACVGLQRGNKEIEILQETLLSWPVMS